MRGYLTDRAAPGGLRLEGDLAQPATGMEDLVVEVRASGVNRGELALLEQRPDGWRPGQDVAGIVVEAAAGGGLDGHRPPQGTRIVGVVDGGSWSERVAVPLTQAAVLPDEVGFEAAAALPIAGLTALRALRAGPPLLGRRVLVTGATGAVGHLAVQLAVAAGAEVTAVVSSHTRQATAAALGADHVRTSVGEGDGPFDLVLDGVGGTLLRDAVRRLAAGGVAATYGTLGGAAPLDLADFAPPDGKPGPWKSLVGVFHAHPSKSRGEDLATLAALVADGRLRPHLGSVRDWSELPETLDALRLRQIRGKAVLTIPDR